MAIEGFRVHIEGDALGYHWANVLHFLVDNDNDAAPLALAQELSNGLTPIMQNFWTDFNSISTVVRWISVRRILPGGGNTWWKEYPAASLKGAQSVELASVSLAPIVKLYSGLEAGVQGRIFLPPPPDTSVEENVITTGYNNFVLAWIEELEGISLAHEWSLGVYSRKLGQVVDVTTSTMSPILGQIKRRRQPL